MMRRMVVMGLAVTAGLALAACGGGSGAGGSVAPSSGAGQVCTVVTESGDVQATIQGNAYDPNAIALTAGQAVTFSNGDGVPHTVTLDDGKCDTGNIAGGASATLRFDEAGSYPFHCEIHPTMKGTFEVT